MFFKCIKEKQNMFLCIFDYALQDGYIRFFKYRVRDTHPRSYTLRGQADIYIYINVDTQMWIPKSEYRKVDTPKQLKFLSF